ncbi:hypothetical protein PDE_04649 [Penicillium oxalicum 114-2]|uniref:Uncharacterized protein n=1 Tax=Penicillium oxalicum (strain 114-2 / CGMCC 5302) TaxID=933388 RepID=S7ZHG0_PENO1|nr:hypothetical protein PDE_04649 [Penicillium oxalicum 114-2]
MKGSKWHPRWKVGEYLTSGARHADKAMWPSSPIAAAIGQLAAPEGDDPVRLLQTLANVANETSLVAMVAKKNPAHYKRTNRIPCLYTQAAEMLKGR